MKGRSELNRAVGVLGGEVAAEGWGWPKLLARACRVDKHWDTPVYGGEWREGLKQKSPGAGTTNPPLGRKVSCQERNVCVIPRAPLEWPFSAQLLPHIFFKRIIMFS